MFGVNNELLVVGVGVFEGWYVFKFSKFLMDWVWYVDGGFCCVCNGLVKVVVMLDSGREMKLCFCVGEYVLWVCDEVYE